jgi:putative DNA primase/helicase
METLTSHLKQRPAYEREKQRAEAHANRDMAGGTAPAEDTPLASILAGCLIPAAQLVTMQLPRRRRLLCKWLCEADLGYVFAARGVGKTWLAMALPAAISQGAPLGLWQAGEAKARVLYVDGEMPLELTQYRCRGLNHGSGDVVYLHHEALFDHHESSLNIGTPRHREALTTLLTEQGFQVLILDNLSSLASGVDENKGDEYEPIGHWLLELRRRKITVIVVHHAGRNNLMRGHSKREDACSWILELRDAKAEGEQGAKFISHFAKPSRNTGEPMPDLLWHFTTDGGRVAIHCEVAREGEYELFIQHVLEGAENQQDIAEMMGKNKGTVSKWARKAAQEGRLKRQGKRLLPPPAASPSHPENGQD